MYLSGVCLSEVKIKYSFVLLESSQKQEQKVWPAPVPDQNASSPWCFSTVCTKELSWEMEMRLFCPRRMANQASGKPTEVSPEGPAFFPLLPVLSMTKLFPLLCITMHLKNRKRHQRSKARQNIPLCIQDASQSGHQISSKYSIKKLLLLFNSITYKEFLYNSLKHDPKKHLFVCSV